MSGSQQPGPQPGQQPTPQQMQQIQQQLAAEAAKRGMTVPQYVEQLKAQAMRQHQAQQAAAAQQSQQKQAQGHSHQHQQQQQVAVTPGPPKPEALAVATFLRSQPLKPRTCIFQEKRKDMFRVKRAIRALQSPAYQKARAKNPLLPPVTDRASAENAFKLLPLSLLALRVSKIDPHAGHNHGKPAKRVKGLWTVRVEPQQDAHDDHHYVWLYEGSQWRQKLYAVGALALVAAVVMFPLWPLFMRQGVWYLSMGMLGLVGLFILLSIFRLILFAVTAFAVPPGLWLYPNLFEDVGFFDSFKPIWGWHETTEQIKAKNRAKKAAKAAKKAEKEAKAAAAKPTANGSTPKASKPSTPQPQEKPNHPAKPAAGANESVKSTPASSQPSTDASSQRSLHASVEEADDE